MKKLYRGPYIDVFCQVWFHLVQLFQRSRLKYEKLTDGRRMPSDGNTSHDPLGQVSLKREQKINRKTVISILHQHDCWKEIEDIIRCLRSRIRNK